MAAYRKASGNANYVLPVPFFGPGVAAHVIAALSPEVGARHVVHLRHLPTDSGGGMLGAGARGNAGAGYKPTLPKQDHRGLKIRLE